MRIKLFEEFESKPKLNKKFFRGRKSLTREEIAQIMIDNLPVKEKEEPLEFLKNSVLNYLDDKTCQQFTNMYYDASIDDLEGVDSEVEMKEFVNAFMLKKQIKLAA